MKEYLRMSDVFPVEIYTDDESGSLIVDDDGIILESFSGDKMADYTLHAINSHDELVAEVDRLRGLIERIISSAQELAKKMPSTEFGEGYKQCAMGTASAIESCTNKGA